MQIDPRFLGSFSLDETAKMRRIFELAIGHWPSTHAVNDDLKYKLASAIIYICNSEKEAGAFLLADDQSIAAEALYIIMQLPVDARTSQFEGIVSS